MLDIKFIRDNPDQVKAGLKTKQFDSRIIDELLPLDDESRTIQTEIEQLRAERNKISALGPHAAEQGRKIKQQLDDLDQQYKTKSDQVKTILASLPNIPSTDSPVGVDENDNVVLRKEGEPSEITDAKDHMAIAEQYDLIDSERAVKIAESRFNFLKNQAVILEFALVRFALDIAQKHGFTPMITPQLVNEDTAQGTGYLSKTDDVEKSEVYKTQDNLYLIGTSEMALVAYHKDELLMEKNIPKRYVGFSTCFRREAGSYGKDTKGILRQHQFDKVELVSVVKPEDSDQELDRILAIEEEIMQTLQLPYQVLQICTGDLGFQAAKKFDIETWMPGQQKYRETHSCSNTTDFQSRRLNIRYKNSEGKNDFVHTLNGTAVAIGRMIIAILENGQQPDGSIKIPGALHSYTGFPEIR